MDHLGDSTIVSFLANRLGAAECADIEEHIDRCSECRELVSALADVAQAPTLAEAIDADGELASRWSAGMVVADRFEIGTRVGAGGMGTVFRATDRVSGATVALKAVLDVDPDHVARFAREARILAELDDPAIVRYVAHGVTRARQAYLAMEWLEGEDLAARLARGPLAIRDAIALARRVAEGLAAANARGVVHRDVKPRNIFLPDGRLDDPRIIDFGIARAPRTNSAATRSGLMLGTPGYMAPEQARATSRVDARADVFALGCVLYECLTARRAFAGDDLLEVLAKILLETPPRLGALVSGVPPQLDDLVAAMLEKDPADRPRDCEAVAGVLRELESADDLSAVAATARSRSSFEGLVRSVSQRVRTIARRARIAWVPSAVIGFVGVVGLAMLVGWRLSERRRAIRPGDGANAGAVTGIARPVAAPGAPVTVLVLGFENRTTEPAFGGTLESIFASALYRSRSVVGIAGTGLRALAAELGGAEPLPVDEQLAAKLAQRDARRVVTVRGVASPKNAGFTLSIVATDASGAALGSWTRDAPSDARVVPTLGLLATDLLTAFGELAPANVQMAEDTSQSTSIVADHELMLGRELGDSGNYAESIRHVELALNVDPDFAVARFVLGMELANAGRIAEARAAYRHALQLADRLEEHTRLRWIAPGHAELGDYAGAESEYLALLAQRPNDAAGETGLTTTYLLERQFAKALAIAERAAVDHPRNAIIRANAVLGRLNVGDFEAAARLAREVIAEFAHPPPNVHTFLALSEKAQGHGAEAEVAVAALEKRDRSFADAVRADFAMYDGRLADAETSLVSGIAQDIADAREEAATSKWATLAEVRMRRGDTRGAIAAAEKAIAHDGTTTPYRGAEILAAAGKPDRALEVAARLRARANPDARMYASLLEGHVLRAKGKAREALARYGDAQKIGDSWIGHLASGKAFVDVGDFEAAARELQTCVARRGETAVSLYGDAPTLHALAEATYWLDDAHRRLHASDTRL